MKGKNKLLELLFLKYYMQEKVLLVAQCNLMVAGEMKLSYLSDTKILSNFIEILSGLQW